MNGLKIGYSKLNINPPMGINVAGYYVVRKAEGILDDLYASAMAVSDGANTALMISLDLLGLRGRSCDEFIKVISEKTGIPEEAIFLSSSHTHTGPLVDVDLTCEPEASYWKWLLKKICDVSNFAIKDLSDAKMAYGISEAPRISFGRRYKMKDGSCRTNPGVNNPDIVEPIGEVDERVSVVRFDREGKETVLLINFGTHPDVVGGNLISADWPGFAKKTLEATLDNVSCIFFNGAQGDVNHVNVKPLPGEGNGMFHDFDDVDRGYPHARHMGNVIASAVLRVYEKLNYVEADRVAFAKENVKIPANVPAPEALPLAFKYNELHLAGRDDEIPYKGMALTTELARAARSIRLKDGPEFFELPLTVIVIGKLGFIGIPGEPFTTIGLGLKASASDGEIIIPCALTNGYKGYFPNMDAYTEGGYEAASSNFKAGVAEIIIEEGAKLLKKVL